MPAIQEKIIRPVDGKHEKLILSPPERRFPPLSRLHRLMTSHRARSGPRSSIIKTIGLEGMQA